MVWRWFNDDFLYWPNGWCHDWSGVKKAYILLNSEHRATKQDEKNYKFIAHVPDANSSCHCSFNFQVPFVSGYSRATMKCSKWSAKSFFRYFRNICDINGQYASAASTTSVHTKNTAREIILYRKLTMKTYCTHLLLPPNGSERAGSQHANAAMANGIMCSFFSAFVYYVVPWDQLAAVHLKPSRKQKLQRQNVALLRAGRLFQQNRVRSFFFFVCPLLVLLLIYVVRFVLCTCATCSKWTRGRRARLRKSFPHSRACEKESFARRCFFFHFRFSVSSPVNAIVDRNPLVNSVQRRQSRRKESQRVCVALKCF